MVVVVVSKSSCNMLSITIIVMLSQILQVALVAIYSHFMRNLISANIFITYFSNLFGLLFLK